MDDKVEKLIRWVTRASELESMLLFGEGARFTVDSVNLCDKIIKLELATKEDVVRWTNEEADSLNA